MNAMLIKAPEILSSGLLFRDGGPVRRTKATVSGEMETGRYDSRPFKSR